MTSIIDPNLAYVLLVIGFVLSVLAILTPGTGLVEIGGIFTLIIGGYGVISNPNNLWAFIFVIPFLPLILIYRKQKKDFYLILAIIFLNIGAYAIFSNGNNGFAVSIPLALIVLLINAPILWFIVKRITEALERKPDFNPLNVIGKIGEARTNISPEGTAYIDGEEWSVRSAEKIYLGNQVKVIGKDGLVLIVEPFSIESKNLEA